MAGTTYSKFFWSDWSDDKELIICSMAAQGFWMRLLCIAAGSERQGHVLVAGRKPTLQELHDITRCPLDQIELLTAELVRNEVCGLDRDGVIISRRLVRDARRRNISAEGGKSRQRQLIDKQEKPFIGTRRLHVQAARATISQSPESINQKPSVPESIGDGLTRSLSKAEALCEAIGESLTADTRRANWPPMINRMIAEGITFEAMLEAARALKASGRLPDDGVRTPMFFKNDALAVMRRIARPAAIGEASAAPEVTEDDWKYAFAQFCFNGTWYLGLLGPLPTDPGCRAPAPMRARFDGVWVRLGSRPFGRPIPGTQCECVPDNVADGGRCSPYDRLGFEAFEGFVAGRRGRNGEAIPQDQWSH